MVGAIVVWFRGWFVGWLFGYKAGWCLVGWMVVGFNGGQLDNCLSLVVGW